MDTIPTELRGKSPAELKGIADYLGDCLRNLHQNGDEVRSLTDDEQAAFDAGLALRAAAVAMLERHKQIGDLAEVPEQVERTAPNINRNTSPMDVLEDRSATPAQLVDALTRSMEERLDDQPDNVAQIQRIVRQHTRHARPGNRDYGPTVEWARELLGRSTETYERAFFAYLAGRGDTLDAEERAALNVGTNANGGYLVPTHLDPSLIITNSGSSNVIRQIAREVTVTNGNVWHGVTTAGMTMSVDGELTEVSDDTPTVGTVSIPIYKMQGFIQASIEAFEDISGLTNDVQMLFADGRDRLEENKFTVGSGTNEPKGVFTAIAAVSGDRVVSGTAATIALADLHALYAAVPVRWRSRASWLMNPTYALAVKALGTAVSASYSTDLTQAPSDRLLGKPAYESDDATATQTTTALDAEILLGDFSNFVIVDKPGGFSVEFIPHLFNTANNLPDGRRGWYAHWRAGSDVVNTAAFRLLVDKTSA